MPDRPSAPAAMHEPSLLVRFPGTLERPQTFVVVSANPADIRPARTKENAMCTTCDNVGYERMECGCTLMRCEHCNEPIYRTDGSCDTCFSPSPSIGDQVTYEGQPAEVSGIEDDGWVWVIFRYDATQMPRKVRGDLIEAQVSAADPVAAAPSSPTTPDTRPYYGADGDSLVCGECATEDEKRRRADSDAAGACCDRCDRYWEIATDA